MEGVLDTRSAHVKRGIALEVFTIAYNSLEAVISITLGYFAGSIALLGFGLDSVIEVTSGGTLLWRLQADNDLASREKAEKRALKVVGLCFLALAAYVAYEAIESLVAREAPARTVPGIVLAAVSVVVMPLLARAKRQVAARIGSAALTADSKQTSLCTYLSLILLVGLGLNVAFGWWWADPLAGLAMIPIILREDIDAVRGRTCCATCH